MALFRDVQNIIRNTIYILPKKLAENNGAYIGCVFVRENPFPNSNYIITYCGYSRASEYAPNNRD